MNAFSTVPQPATEPKSSTGAVGPAGTSTTGSLLQGLTGNFLSCQD